MKADFSKEYFKIKKLDLLEKGLAEADPRGEVCQTKQKSMLPHCFFISAPSFESKLSTPGAELKNRPPAADDFCFVCREEGIRTLDTVTRILPFQGSSFNHSDTSLFGDCKFNRIFGISSFFENRFLYFGQLASQTGFISFSEFFIAQALTQQMNRLCN